MVIFSSDSRWDLNVDQLLRVNNTTVSSSLFTTSSTYMQWVFIRHDNKANVWSLSIVSPYVNSCNPSPHTRYGYYFGSVPSLRRFLWQNYPGYHEHFVTQHIKHVQTSRGRHPEVIFLEVESLLWNHKWMCSNLLDVYVSEQALKIRFSLNKDPCCPTKAKNIQVSFSMFIVFNVFLFFFDLRSGSNERWAIHRKHFQRSPA